MQQSSKQFEIFIFRICYIYHWLLNWLLLITEYCLLQEMFVHMFMIFMHTILNKTLKVKIIRKNNGQCCIESKVMHSFKQFIFKQTNNKNCFVCETKVLRLRNYYKMNGLIKFNTIEAIFSL